MQSKAAIFEVESYPAQPLDDEMLEFIKTKEVVKATFSPEELRDQAGRWTAEGRVADNGDKWTDHYWQDKAPSDYKPHRPDGLDTSERFSDGKGEYTLQRKRLHAEIISKFMAGTTRVDSPTATILGGGMAAGKSTLVKFNGIGKENSVLVSVDEIRPLLPEFKPTPEKPVSIAFTHEEASDISKALILRAVQGKRNMVLDGTGDTTLNKLGGKVALMRAGGHKIMAEYVTCPLELAQARADERGKKIGRFVPPTAMAEMHKSVSKIFPEAVRQGLFDEARLHDTDVPFGKRPVLVASSVGKELTIHDKVRWEQFLAKGN